MMLTMQHEVTRRVQWRQTSIDIDPSAVAVALASTTPSQSPIEEQPRWSPPQTQSTLLPALDQMQAKAMKNVHGKSHSQQWKMSSNSTKGKKPVKELIANPMLPTTVTQANPKFVMGKPMLTVNTLKLAGKSCVELQNYYINNYNKGQETIVSYKDRHFLVGDSNFLISWSNLYDLFNLDALDVSLMRCFALQVPKN
jgi:hypothetical protein